MNKIRILESHIANQIAAGEVVERPSSVVKELVENAIDAGATAITVEIKNGGIDYIRVTDNGGGIVHEDCLIAFERHATSKISKADDLNQIETLGFRGEALSSIAAVTQLSLQTIQAGAQTGSLVRIEGGEVKEYRQVSAAPGTTIVVENLFYNVPARRKFLKNARTETGSVGAHIERMIMGTPAVSFRYLNNGKSVYRSAGDNQLKNAVYCVYGKDILPHLKTVSLDNGYVKIEGYIVSEEVSRPNRRDQHFFLNGRAIQSFMLSDALQRAYDTRLMGGRFPLAMLHITIASREVDVNVHPAKLEVRFAEESRVDAAMFDACQMALGHGTVFHMSFPSSKDTADGHARQNNAANASDGVVPAQMEQTEVVPAAPAQYTRFQLDNADSRFTVKEDIFEIPHYSVTHRESALRPAREDDEVTPAQPGTPPVQQDESQTHALDESSDKTLYVEARQQFGAAPLSIIGQMFQSYWVVQQGDVVYFVDQHAAHERRLYNALMQSEGEKASQALLAPEILELTQAEYMLLMEHIGVMQSLGFTIVPFGPSSVRISEVPVVLTGAPIGAVLRDALELLRRQGRATNNDLKREAIVQSSCKHAVKAGDPLTKEEITALLQYFQGGQTPLTCPHGRPIIIKLTRKELEKLFRRIV
jgi:DNA mismatch repair protein MutL